MALEPVEHEINTAMRDSPPEEEEVQEEDVQMAPFDGSRSPNGNAQEGTKSRLRSSSRTPVRRQPRSTGSQRQGRVPTKSKPWGNYD